ncbi:MAG: hypothetical protein ACRCWT_20755, partial [Aeromonas veronii]
GQIRMTLSRGEIVARDGEFTGQRGHGRFLARAPFDPLLGEAVREQQSAQQETEQQSRYDTGPPFSSESTR